MNDAERLYAHWREHARDEADRLYIEDRIARVTRLLAEHGRVRVVRLGI
jgi:putative component of toxin-antitoxin plasmid stabilization module